MTLLPSLLLACAQPLPVDSDPLPAPAVDPFDGVDYAVVLTLDGARVEESFGDGTSDLTGGAVADQLPRVRAELFPRGTLVKPGYSTGITVTGPAHCALTTGASNTIANFPVDTDPGLYVPDTPTILEVASAAGWPGVLVANAKLAIPATYSAWPGLGRASGASSQVLSVPDGGNDDFESDKTTLDTVFEALDQGGAHVVVANLHDTDRAGHYGEEGAYPAVLSSLDGPLVELWARIEAHERLGGHTLLVVTSDHGRHANEADEAWRSHGDDCSGCREVPMLWLGPGVAQGKVLETTWSLEDVTATLARALRLPLPLADGHPIDGLFEAAGDLPWAAGASRVVASSGAVGRLDVGGDPGRRVVFTVDGDTLSSASAWTVSGAQVASGGGSTYACWRELELPPGAPVMPSTLRCAVRTDGTWASIGFPLNPVSPLAAPGLAVDGQGRLRVAFVDNPTGGLNTREGVVESVFSLSWSEEAKWASTGTGLQNGVGATEPAVAAADDLAVVAWTASYMEGGGRDQRHPEVFRVDTPESEPSSWARLYPQDGSSPGNPTPTAVVDEVGHTWGRLERVAVALTEGTVHLATVAYREGATGVLLFTGTAAAGDFDTPRELDGTGRVLPNVTPVLAGGELWWARLDEEGVASVCRAGVEGGATACTSTGLAAVASLAVDAGVAWYTARDDQGDWTVAQVRP